ncbi:MAG TPA: ATP-binding protein [Phycisphaerales bacterium]|nr:ATP-binding protein [Phycisphaerales bacterium]
MDSPDRSPEHNPAPRDAAARSAKLAPRDSGASSTGADRLTVLAHELGNILDGSLRCLGLAERALDPATPPRGDPGDEARRKLETVRAALHRMAEIVDAAMKAPSAPLAAEAPIELGEAIFHAVDVLTPVASERRVRIKACVSNGLSGVPAGPLYPVIINGLANAIDAIAAAGRAAHEQTGGSVDVTAGWTDDGRVRIEIRDDGVGLPADAPSEAVFRFGFSTKPGGAGVGLAVARAIVDELTDGSLRLFTRADRPRAGRPGAILEVTFRPARRESAA